MTKKCQCIDLDRLRATRDLLEAYAMDSANPRTVDIVWTRLLNEALRPTAKTHWR